MVASLAISASTLAIPTAPGSARRTAKALVSGAARPSAAPAATFSQRARRGVVGARRWAIRTVA
jgi:hypothetical protein